MGFLFACIWLLTPLPHDYHVSLTQIEHNAEAGTLEAVMRLFTDDLERALATRLKKRVDLTVDPRAEDHVRHYLAEVFQIQTKAKTELPVRWVGMEVEGRQVWVYLEVTLPDSGVAGLAFRNRVFMEQFRDQVNTVNIKSDGRLRSLVFKRDDGFKNMPEN